MTDPDRPPGTSEPVSWPDLAQQMWHHLTTTGGAVSYQFVDVEVALPGRGGLGATVTVNGSLRVSATPTPRDSDGGAPAPELPA